MNRAISLSTIIRIIIAFSLIILFILEIVNFDNIKKNLQVVERKNIEYFIEENIDTIASLKYFDFNNELKELIDSLVSSSKSIHTITIIEKKPSYLSPNELIFPLKYQNKNLGYLDIKYSYTLSNEFIEKYLPNFLTYIFTLIFLALITTHYISKKIDSLKKLSQKLEHIDIKNLKKIFPLDNYKEIIVITTAINRLLREIKLAFKKLVESEKHLKEAQKIANMSSWEYNEKFHTFFCSTQLFRILGLNFKKDRLTWERFLDFIDSEDRVKFLELLNELKSGGKQFEEVLKFNVQKKERYLKNVVKIRKKRDYVIFIGIVLDVTEEIKAKKQVEFLAYHDPLTSLPNRASFKEIVHSFAKITKRNHQKFGLIFIDLDNFKFINDSYGHDIGDRLLIDTANALRSSLRESDLIFRIGGDEFVVLVANINDKDSMIPIMKKILRTISKEYNYDGHSFVVTCSLGAAIFPDDSEDIETLIRYADLAMYEAKGAGKNQFRFFEIHMKQFLDHFQQTAQDLRQALEKEDELILFYQPKVDIQTKQVIGAETLIRWLHPQKGLLTPNQFIPVAEKSDLIIKLDYYVLKKSIKQLASWQNDPMLNDITLSLNISARTFKDPLLLDTIKEFIARYSVDPQKLEIEITETLSMEDVLYTTSVLKKMKELGLKVALDDFGTGYSSLNYLKQLPFDTLKIDRSFIKDIDKDSDDLQITKIIVDIALNFQKLLVAEGVENEHQEKILLQLGSRLAQGYHYSKPIDLEKFIDYIRKHNR